MCIFPGGAIPLAVVSVHPERAAVVRLVIVVQGLMVEKLCPALVLVLLWKMTMCTLSKVKLGQLYWDDIKILGHQVGHLISKF